MCGLFAWWSTTPIENGAKKTLNALTALLPRGPDEQHIVAVNASTYLAHCRLKITGENGSQPLWNKERSVVALVNGQFYNYKTLRAQAERDGYEFQTESDSELLLALYHTHQHESLNQLDGEFAFVLWDLQRDTVWAARDRSGVKPLRFMCTDTDFVFASEAKAFFAAGFPAQWNPIALTQALMFQYPAPNNTLFAGVQQIAPGQSLLATRKNGMWTHTLHYWWTWFPKEKPFNSATGYLDHLQDAVSQRVDGKWPTAVHLSAGCDSTTALIMAQETQHPVTAFGVGFETDPHSSVVHDESSIAAQTAQQLNVPFCKVLVKRSDMLQHWNDATYHSEGLAINGHLVAKWLLSKEIQKQGFRISISGEGADEALLGYSFLTAQMGSDLQTLQQKNPVSVGLMLPDNNQLQFPQVEKEWGFVPVWLKAKSSLGWKLQSLMQHNWIEQYCQQAESEWAEQTAGLLNKDTPLVHQAASSWAVLALGGYILPTLADAPETAHHIQGRVPFLAKNVLTEAFLLTPEETGYPIETKQPIRNYLRSKGFSAIADRQKHPFQAPPLLGDANVRQLLSHKWRNFPWERTPFCSLKIHQWIDTWETADIATHQNWEPVVATLLSICSMTEMFELNIQPQLGEK